MGRHESFCFFGRKNDAILVYASFLIFGPMLLLDCRSGGAVIVYASLGVFVLLLIAYGSVYTFGPILTVASLHEFDFIPVFASILS